MPEGPLSRYRAMVKAGDLEPDQAQLLAAEKLQLLANRLLAYTPPARTDFFSFFTRRRGEVPGGLYIFGGVGRGKTMLMDLFYETVALERKRRIHFHEFMADVHDRIGKVRKSSKGDPLPQVGNEIAELSRLLCFDELHVTDIADAMILGRLFNALFANNVVVIATSNTAPRELYKDGLNRQLFLPFIDLLEDNMEVLALEAEKDYRLEKLQGSPLYFSPADAKARKSLRLAWRRLTGDETGSPTYILVKGRRVEIPEAHGGAAYFRYQSIFEAALGPNDYLAIADAFHTVFIEGVPTLAPDKRNEARRMVTFIDALYDKKVRLLISADAEPHEIYIEGDGVALFERTASRLIEMRSKTYLSEEHGVPRAS